jgi:hypothetical protein
MSGSRSASRVVVLASSLAGGCAYWAPHSLVASDKPFSGVVEAGPRIHKTACRTYVFGIPGPGDDPKIDNVMDMLYTEAPKALGFQDVRFDESFVNYFLWLFVDRCVDVTASPVYPKARGSEEEGASPRKPKPAPSAPEAPPPGGASPGASKEQLNRWLDPPKQPAPAKAPSE